MKTRSRAARIARRMMQFSLAALLAAVLVAGLVFQQSESILREYFRDRSLIVPTSFDVTTGKNVLWTARLGSMAWGGPTVSGGKIFVGSNNAAGYLDQYPPTKDMGVLLCFDIKDGSFLWQDSNEKHPSGRVHDWPLQGVTSAPAVEGDRLWYVSNLAEVVCLDTEGFYDDEDDGIADIKPRELSRRDPAKMLQADTVWRFDMMANLNVFPHNASCSGVAFSSHAVFVNTGNAVNETHLEIPNPQAPSFLALDKKTGKVLWSDHSPGENILHGAWGTPTYAVIAGQPQVIFPGGDGWLYSFDPAGAGDGKSKLLWKFDCNPKDTKWQIGGRGTRNNLLAAPTVAGDLVFVAMGQDPDHGDGPGRVLCIDPTKRGDVSPSLVFNSSDPHKAIPHRRVIACDEERGDFTRRNPNSALVWEHTNTDLNSDGKTEFEEEMHRSISRVAVKNDLAVVTDASGIVHCLDANSGRAHWTFDLYAGCWTSPIISADHIYTTDEDGAVTVFKLSADPKIAMPAGKPVSATYLPKAAYATPLIVDNVLYLVASSHLIAVKDQQSKK